MTDPLLLAAFAIVPTTIGSVATWYGTKVSLAKVRSDEAQQIIERLMVERREREQDIRSLKEEVRSQAADIRKLQDEREQVSDAAHEMFALDRRIRHDSSTLIRNALFRGDPDGDDPAWQDLRDRSAELEVLRERRRCLNDPPQTPRP